MKLFTSNCCVAGICERDMDLLLQEEFIASIDFCNLVADKIKICLDKSQPLISTDRSVTSSLGESDLEVVLLLSDGDRIKILIENKISAAFQPHQADRYRERGEISVRNGECDSYKTLLIAPSDHTDPDNSDKGFDEYITYEEILFYLEKLSSDDPRYEFKSYLLRGALEKAKHGYQQVEDEQVTKFWRGYWKICSEIAPELNMTYPESRPATSGFIYFSPKGLPKDVYVVHKLPFGHIDLQFSGKGEDLGEMHESYKEHLQDEMIITKAGKSAVIRIKVPELNAAIEISNQIDDAKHGIMEAARLYQWYIDATTIS